MCEDCKYMEWVGGGSKSQQTTFCTKLDEPFMVFLEDVCDEFTIKPPKPPKPAPPPGRILREPGLFQFNKK
jgi:hypothetical protein